jgi:type VI protein secretion system component VasK
MSALLLFAILITLLGAWPLVGNTLVVVLLLLAAAGVLIGVPVMLWQLWAWVLRIDASLANRPTAPAGDEESVLDKAPPVPEVEEPVGYAAFVEGREEAS